MQHNFSDILNENRAKSDFDRITAKTHMPVGKVLLQYQTALRALGLLDPNEQRLGRGSFGVAFKTNLGGTTSVVKLTRDPFEVITSAYLRGKSFAHVVPIYEVWGLEGTQEKKHWAPWYVVHRAYLSPLRESDKRLIDIIFDIFVEEEHLDVPTPGARSMRAKWEGIIKDDLREHRNVSELPRAMTILDQISAGVRELRSVGMDWEDFHSGNLMVGPGGAIQIADVGYGAPRKDQQLLVEALTEDRARDYAKSWKKP